MARCRHAEYVATCHRCRLYARDPAYRAHWGGGLAGTTAPAPRPAAAPRRALPCVHLGGQKRAETCASCGGRIQIKVFACDVYRETTLAKPLAGIQCCASCPKYEPKS
jgi:hypothetical protein